MRWLILAIPILLTLSDVNCTSAPVKTPPAIRGQITSINRAQDTANPRGIIGSILIEGAKEADTSFDRASVTITNKTRIYRRQGQQLSEMGFDSLLGGQRVEAWFTGPVAESYPVQATAEQIAILGDASPTTR